MYCLLSYGTALPPWLYCFLYWNTLATYSLCTYFTVKLRRVHNLRGEICSNLALMLTWNTIIFNGNTYTSWKKGWAFLRENFNTFQNFWCTEVTIIPINERIENFDLLHFPVRRLKGIVITAVIKAIIYANKNYNHDNVSRAKCPSASVRQLLITNDPRTNP